MHYICKNTNKCITSLYFIPHIFFIFNNSDFPSVHCHIKLHLRHFVCVLLSSLYLHLTWKSIIKSYRNWIIRLTLTAYFSSIEISPLSLKAIEWKRNHAFILHEHVGFLSSQCVINFKVWKGTSRTDSFPSGSHTSVVWLEFWFPKCPSRMPSGRGYSISSRVSVQWHWGRNHFQQLSMGTSFILQVKSCLYT